MSYGQKLGMGTNESCDLNQITIQNLAKSRYEIIDKYPKEKYPDKDLFLPFIVIGKLGTNETNQRYNLQRLKETKTFLTQISSVPSELVILAQGEKVKGKGEIDIYFDGILQYSITLKHNQNLNLIKGGFCYQ